jgi:hypothetical protein
VAKTDKVWSHTELLLWKGFSPFQSIVFWHYGFHTTAYSKQNNVGTDMVLKCVGESLGTSDLAFRGFDNGSYRISSQGQARVHLKGIFPWFRGHLRCSKLTAIIYVRIPNN